MEIKKVLISEVQLWDKNPRNIKTKDFVRLKKQIEELGVYKPLIAFRENGKYTVLGGNMRLRALQEMGLPEIEISIVEADTEAKRIKYALSDNDRAGEYDEQQLAELVYPHIEEIDLLEYKVDLAEPVDLKQVIENYGPNLDGSEDEVPEIDDSPAITKPGDLFTLGRHRLLCGDATKEGDVSRLADGKKMELSFTSPPYSDMRDYGGNDLNINTLIKFIDIIFPLSNYLVINLGVKREKYEIIEYWQSYIERAKKCGYKFLSWNIWNRMAAGSLAQQTAMFAIDHEWLFVFGKKYKPLNRTIMNNAIEYEKRHPNHLNVGANRGTRVKNGSIKTMNTKSHTHKQLGTVVDIYPQLARNVDSSHPAMFPIDLPVEYLKAMTNEEDNVFDPFVGSGTTLIACEKLDRICYGMEIEPKYCDVIIRRYCNYTETLEEDIRATVDKSGK